ncbi:tRNA uridine-5-carboxymethylaminomethyl(34) synthesis GTPase MnmE [Pyruvatibacter sp.]|uniref:tRNA uridine-5-carboxymethylaminomethyl(34) synthesis GTPase MnmE n=1 Tax=Pyruvatibacter sp. TaxID=1981328 RepID=UPI0032EE3051
MDSTIFALSSGQGRAGIAVIRVSGGAAGAAIRALTGVRLPSPRRATVRTLTDPETGDMLDKALVLWLPGPGTVTGEDMAEFHVHGGRAVVLGVLNALGALESVRLAEPGEFTRRAFGNGRMDLTQVEGLADLIEAETAGQRRLALAQAEGGLAARCAAWRETLIGALALVEAEIDFSDEELPDGLNAQAVARISLVTREMADILAFARRGEIMRDGVQVAILGPPNVGKSSLLNRLARRDAAIVSDISGTTRDVIEVRLDLGGIPVVLADTAGLRETDDPLEREGIARSHARAAGADIALLVSDLSQGGHHRPDWPVGIGQGRKLNVGNKADIADSAAPDGIDIAISAKSGAGMDALEAWLLDAAMQLAGGAGVASVVGRARQAAALGDAHAALERCLEESRDDGEAALVSEELRLALRALGRLVGAVDVEDVLDVIFRDFCIGK